MTLDKTHFIVFIVGAVLGLLSGFFIGKAIYDRPVIESVTRDTVIVYDTIPHYYPKPVDSAVVRYVTKVLPVRPDTHHFADVSNMIDSVSSVSNSANSVTDSVAVVVPITTKHYRAMEYDAWVSGYEPNLDSIKVYQKETVITETITKVVKENKHFFLDVGTGCEYRFNDKAAVPFAEIGLKFKTGRFGIGAYGGYSHDTNENKGLPNGRVKITYDIISF